MAAAGGNPDVVDPGPAEAAAALAQGAFAPDAAVFGPAARTFTDLYVGPRGGLSIADRDAGGMVAPGAPLTPAQKSACAVSSAGAPGLPGDVDNVCQYVACEGDGGTYGKCWVEKPLPNGNRARLPLPRGGASVRSLLGQPAPQPSPPEDDADGGGGDGRPPSSPDEDSDGGSSLDVDGYGESVGGGVERPPSLSDEDSTGGGMGGSDVNVQEWGGEGGGGSLGGSDKGEDGGGNSEGGDTDAAPAPASQPGIPTVSKRGTGESGMDVGGRGGEDKVSAAKRARLHSEGTGADTGASVASDQSVEADRFQSLEYESDTSNEKEILSLGNELNISRGEIVQLKLALQLNEDVHKRAMMEKQIELDNAQQARKRLEGDVMGFTEAKKTVARLMSEKAQLESQHAQTVALLQTRITELENANEATELSLNITRGQVAELRKMKEDAVSELAQVQKERDELTRTHGLLQQTVAASQRELQSCAASTDVLKTKLANKSSTLSTTKTELSETRTSLSAADARVQELESSIQTLRTQLREAAEEQAALRQRFTQDSADQANVATLKAEKARMLDEYAQTMAQREATISALRANLETKTAELDATKTSLAHGQAEIAQLQQQAGKYHVDINELTTLKDGLQEELRRIHNVLALTEGQRKKGLTEIRQLTTKIQTAEGTNSALTARLAELLSELDTRAQTHALQQSRIRQLEADVETQKARILELDDTLKTKTTLYDGIANQLAQAQTVLLGVRSGVVPSVASGVEVGGQKRRRRMSEDAVVEGAGEKSDSDTGIGILVPAAGAGGGDESEEDNDFSGEEGDLYRRGD